MKLIACACYGKKIDNFGLKVVDNRSGDLWRTTGLLNVSNGEQHLSHVFSQHDGFTNGWNFDSGAVPYKDSSSDTYQQTKDVENGNGSLHNLENNEDDSWEFQDVFSKSKVETAVSEQQVMFFLSFRLFIGIPHKLQSDKYISIWPP